MMTLALLDASGQRFERVGRIVGRPFKPRTRTLEDLFCSGVRRGETVLIPRRCARARHGVPGDRFIIEQEKHMIAEALRRTKGNKAHAAAGARAQPLAASPAYPPLGSSTPSRVREPRRRTIRSRHRQPP